MKDVRCIDCGKTPGEIGEYIDAGRENGMSPESYVEQEEGTYNPENGHFICTEDFIRKELALGRRPVGSDGGTWTAP
ncbi:hypothetical protein ACFW2V_14090 [Streptomyces sp. NPDC058947]|uniref:hypothetical protein n=1 Tax=Streptomyces sp. NPDC058947 TaxID=3346675 RepID=UPI0036A34255